MRKKGLRFLNQVTVVLRNRLSGNIACAPILAYTKSRLFDWSPFQRYKLYDAWHDKAGLENGAPYYHHSFSLTQTRRRGGGDFHAWLSGFSLWVICFRARYNLAFRITLNKHIVREFRRSMIIDVKTVKFANKVYQNFFFPSWNIYFIWTFFSVSKIYYIILYNELYNFGFM